MLSAPQLPPAERIPGASPPPPAPSVLRAHTAYFAELGAHPFSHPKTVPCLPNIRRLDPSNQVKVKYAVVSSLQEPYWKPLAEISRRIYPGLGSPALSRVWWWRLWAFASYLGSFDLKVNFPINITKKLQRPAKREREAREGGGMAFLLLADQKCSCLREGVFCCASVEEAKRLIGSCH